MQDPALDVNLYNPPFDVNNSIFLQNLRQLRTNLNNIHQAANAPAGHLDVATIANNLHNGLRQSAFTDNAGPHAAGSADVPANPFTVNSGQTAWQSFPSNIPLHASAQSGANINPALANDLTVLNPVDIALFAVINSIIPAGLPPVPYGIVNHTRIVDDNRVCFCNMNPRLLQPGEILVRCTENGALEPGEWWVDISDMPLSIADVRNGTAVRPDWNQNGNLEFFVVPEGSTIVVIEGRAASYQLFSPPRRFVQLAVGLHIQRGQAILPVGNEVTNQWLPGGINQILIIANSRNQGRPIFVPYISCIAIIETGFDVELQ